MPVRDRFPADYFAKNPLKGENARSAYSRLQWGNAPRNEFPNFEAPESMAALGHLAAIVFVNGQKAHFQEREYYVAVGIKTNKVYYVPMRRDGRPLDFPPNFSKRAQPIGLVKRVDYTSEKGMDKGGEPGYYYHDHESPWPTLRQLGSHYVLIPSRLPNGGRSYAVNDEGIIG